MSKKTLAWFKRHVHKRVYVEDTPDRCKCNACQRSVKYGIRIISKEHAEYLHMCSIDMNLNYSKKPFIK